MPPPRPSGHLLSLNPWTNLVWVRRVNVKMPSELGRLRLESKQSDQFRRAFSVQASHTFTRESVVFDERNLVSSAGLVPVMELAEQAGLSELIGEHVDVDSVRVRSGAVNPVGKLTSIIAAMACGADCIDDAELLRSGGTPIVFDDVYAASTLGIFLREFSFGHAQQVAAVARRHLIALAARTPLLDGITERAFLDIDSMLRPVYGHNKQGASFGHAKIAGKSLLRRGLSPLITTLSTPVSAPVIAEMRLRSGKTGSGKGAASQIKAAAATARACGAGTIMLRGDSAFGNKHVVRAALSEGIEFSVAMARNQRIDRAIAEIPDAAWTPVRYPGAVIDPDTGKLISDGPLAHAPSSLFAANSVWALCAGITHNLLRAASTLAGGDLRVARGATLRRKIVNTPARFARPARKPMLHPPMHWPWQLQWKTLWDKVFGDAAPLADTA
jgi:hypothetical protein